MNNMLDDEEEEAPPPPTKREKYLFTVYSDTAKVHQKSESWAKCVEYSSMVYI